MNNSESLQPGMLRLAGISAICVAVFVLPFPVIDGMIGGLFEPEVFYGGSIEPWIQRVSEHNGLARLGMILPMIGFSFMLFAGRALYKIIPGNSWQKQVAMMSYIIGVPLAVTAFATGFSLTTLIGNAGYLSETFPQVAIFPLSYYMYINFVVGPFFIIVIANVFIGLAARKNPHFAQMDLLLANINCIIVLFGIFSIIYPSLSFGQMGGPLTMLWFLCTGIYLLVKRSTLLKIS